LIPRAERRAWFLIGIGAALAVALVYWLAGGVSFWHDECDFLHHRSLADPLGLFAPHNYHPVALAAATYRITVGLFGTATYIPYLALLLLFHVGTAVGLYALLRRERLWMAVAATLLLLFLGSGGDNMFWAFQITFVGSTALGTWGLWAADRRRWAVAAALFTGAVFCSLTGVAFLAGGIAIAAYRRDRGGAWLATPVIVLALWWVAFARDWVRPPDWAFYEAGSLTSASSWSAVPGFVLESVFKVVGNVSGLGPTAAIAAVVMAVAGAGLAWSRGWRPEAIHLASVIGFFTFMTMVGVVRAADADGLRPRFVYVGAVFALMLVPRIPRHPLWVAAAIVLFAIAIGSNILAMPTMAAMWTARAGGALACTP
jgi:hypothetical protein